jgi:hypothetical protein
VLDQLEEFFISYNKQRDKKFKVSGTGGAEESPGVSERGRPGPRESQEEIARGSGTFLENGISSHSVFQSGSARVHSRASIPAGIYWRRRLSALLTDI